MGFILKCYQALVVFEFLQAHYSECAYSSLNGAKRPIRSQLN